MANFVDALITLNFETDRLNGQWFDLIVFILLFERLLTEGLNLMA